MEATHSPVASKQRSSPSRPASPSTPKVTKPKAPVPASLRDCLAPLAAAAIETSTLAYAWGIANTQLLRASAVMDLCGDVVKQANQMITHEVSAQAVQRDIARQEAAGAAAVR